MMDIDKNRKSSPGDYLKDAIFFGLLEDLHRKLYDLQDLKYRDMQIKIIPNVNPESIIGVRTPELKTMAKRVRKEIFQLPTAK